MPTIYVNKRVGVKIGIPILGNPLQSVMQQNNNGVRYIIGRQHTFTIDTGATQSIIRPDIVKGKREALNNVRLWTAIGEFATVHGKTEAKVTIANISVGHVFIVNDIVG